MRALALAAVLLVTGCATTAQQEDPHLWTRIDGQRITGNPVLQTEFDAAKIVCEGEMQRANLSGSSYCRGVIDCLATGIERGAAMNVVGKGCMADRGYMLMSTSQGEAHIAAAAHLASQPKPSIRAPAKPKPVAPAS